MEKGELLCGRKEKRDNSLPTEWRLKRTALHILGSEAL